MKSKRKLIAVAGVSFFIIILFFAVFGLDKKSKMDNDTEEPSFIDKNVLEDEVTSGNKVNQADNSQTFVYIDEEGETWIIEETPYREEFHIKRYDEILPYINNDMDGLEDFLQEQLYRQGYWNYKYAKFLDKMKFYYNTDVLELYFWIDANKDATVRVLYNYRDYEWKKMEVISKDD